MLKKTRFLEKAPGRGRFAAGILVLAVIGLADTARGQIITEFALPTLASSPRGIAAGPDGNLWFTEFYFSDSAQSYVSKIGRITTAGVLTEFQIPTDAAGSGAVVAGPDGNLWFTEPNGGKVGRITTAGAITEFAVSNGPRNIAAGPDGNLWFTESGNRIGRITTAGVAAEFTVPTADPFLTDIVAGPDGNLWFTEQLGGKIGRITPAGVVTEFPIPTPFHTPGGIAVGPDGALWFTDGLPVLIATGMAPRKQSIESTADSGGRIGRITTAGAITEFEIPTFFSGPSSIVAGPDGALWFTESTSFAGKIGRITTAGIISEFPVPTPFGTPTSITAGPDGALWFTESIGKIGRITPSGGACSVSPTNLCLNNARFKVETAWTASDGAGSFARTLPFTQDAGHFWFFSSGNPEIVVKVLNGCAFNNHYWVFGAGLTNLNVILKVTDTQTGLVTTYNNPRGRALEPIQDTNTFVCP